MVLRNNTVSNTVNKTADKTVLSNTDRRNVVEHKLIAFLGRRRLRKVSAPLQTAQSKLNAEEKMILALTKAERKLMRIKARAASQKPSVLEKPSDETGVLGSEKSGNVGVDGSEGTGPVMEVVRRRRSEKRRFLALPPKHGRRYMIDLRIHSAGTLGFFDSGGVDPGPAFVRLAKVRGVDIVALADHHCADNIDVIKNVNARARVITIAGVSLCCKVGECKQVFMIAIFPDNYGTAEVNQVLDELAIPSSARGKKDYCIVLDFDRVLEIVEGHGGVMIPSRLDKTPYRQLAIPSLIVDYGFHAFDLVYPENTDFFKTRWPFGEFTFFSFSNAHSLGQIGNRAKKVKISRPGFDGIKSLVKRRDYSKIASGRARRGRPNSDGSSSDVAISDVLLKSKAKMKRGLQG